MRLLMIVGTRPEAVKMAGLVYELRRRTDVAWTLCSTGQHGTMLDETLADLAITPHIKLGLMQPGQTLSGLTARAVERLADVIGDTRPDWVLVQGDTTTAMTGALDAFYAKIPVGHVEAGLRTWNRYSPWPEEINRKLIGAIATRHFAPTTVSRDNLLKEGIAASDVLVTGNTVIDALQHTARRISEEPALKARLEQMFSWLDSRKRLVLVTGHRRENFGEGLEQVCQALGKLAERGDVEVVYPVHLNPNVRAAVNSVLKGRSSVHLIEPLSYSPFVHLMSRSYMILTDSGGIQEEAPSLGKPVLVMRDTSERPEAIDAGTCELVGTSKARIVEAASRLLDDDAHYAGRSSLANPYGDGQASRRIIESITT